MRWYFLVILLVTILSVAGLLMIAFRFDPFGTNASVKALFLGSFFIALWGVGTLLFSGWSPFFISFRRGLLVSVAVSLSIVLGRLKMFNVWSVILILGAVLAIEWVINKKSKEKEYLQDFN